MAVMNIHHRIYEEALSGPAEMLHGVVEEASVLINESDGKVPLAELLDRTTVALDEAEALIQHLRRTIENARIEAVAV